MYQRDYILRIVEELSDIVARLAAAPLGALERRQAVEQVVAIYAALLKERRFDKAEDCLFVLRDLGAPEANLYAAEFFTIASAASDEELAAVGLPREELAHDRVAFES